jgi:hypothetical protein
MQVTSYINPGIYTEAQTTQKINMSIKPLKKEIIPCVPVHHNDGHKQHLGAYNCPAEGGAEVHGPLTKRDPESFPASPSECPRCSG